MRNVAALLVLFFPLAPRGQPPSFSIVCRAEAPPLVPTPLGAICARGDRLYFALSAGPRWHYFSAVSEMRDGVAVWYFPNATTSSAPIAAGEPWLAQSSEIEETHPLGEATLHGLFSQRPLSEDDVRRALGSGDAQIFVAAVDVVFLPSG